MLTQSNTGQSAGSLSTDLELVNYGAGFAWLRPALDAALRDSDQVDQMLARLLERRPEPQPQPEPDDERVALTDLGRRALAMERLFGKDWPTVAQVQP